MSEPFLAEIKIIGFNFAPRGWAYCDGQILPIDQNQSLYSLLGTTYGGDGRTSFALPDLRGRAPIHKGLAPSGGIVNHTLGQKAGVETVSLTVAEMANHIHEVKAKATDVDREDQPSGATLCKASANSYGDPGSQTQMMAELSCTNTGNGAAHNNMQPYLTLGFCIALQGLFPSRN